MAPPTRITLVRHAETTMLRHNRINGHLDAPLTEAGLRSARKTARVLRGKIFNALYCSSLGRAHHTAEIIGQAIKMEPVPVDGLRERYYGWLEGKSLDWFEPDLTGRWYSRILSRIALTFSGEKEGHFSQRVLQVFTEIHNRHVRQRVLLVVHWGILSVLTRHFLGEDTIDWRRLGPWTNCGITEVRLNGQGWEFIHLDDCSHL